MPKYAGFDARSKEKFSRLLDHIEGYISDLGELSSRMEKLLSLRDEGKVSEKAYFEAYDEIERKFEELRRKKLGAYYEQKAELLSVVMQGEEALKKALATTETILIKMAECLPNPKEFAPAPKDEEAFVLCPRCGSRIDRKATFCFRCGVKLNETTPEVKLEISEKVEKSDIYHKVDESQLKRFCAKCMAPIGSTYWKEEISFFKDESRTLKLEIYYCKDHLSAR
jgi:ribosomal protein L40E